MFSVRSNWGYWDQINGRDIKTGDVLRLENPLGEVFIRKVTIEHGSFTYSDHGHLGHGPDNRAFFIEPPFGATTYIRDLHHAGWKIALESSL